MNFTSLKKKANAVLNEARFIAHIHSEEEYDLALSLMDELVENYDENHFLIEILSASIERYENESAAFRSFNKIIRALDTSTCLLKVLMNQHQLGVSDFPEIGSKSLISKIINRQRRLTLDHIDALSKRFKIDPVLFL